MPTLAWDHGYLRWGIAPSPPLRGKVFFFEHDRGWDMWEEEWEEVEEDEWVRVERCERNLALKESPPAKRQRTE